MKILVTYMSQTGNTQKIAQAIYDEIQSEKELKKARDVRDLEGYDLAFVGFPIHQYGPDKKAKSFLENQCKGKNIALFITHASPAGHEELAGYLAKFEQAATGANLVGMFDCQGELAKGIKLLMKIQPDPKLRSFAQDDNSEGKPDAASLERARVFVKDILGKFHS